MITSQAISRLLEPGLRTLVGKGVRRRDPEYNKYLNVQSTRRSFEENIELANLPIAPQLFENDSIATFDPVVGSTKKHNVEAYAIGVEFSWFAASDEQYGWLRSISGQIGFSIAEAREERCIKVINGAFPNSGASDVTGFDGLTIFNSAHTALGQGKTQSNVTTGDIGIGTLQSALTTLEKLEDHQGKKFRTRGVRLFYDPANQFLVDEILKSSNRPDTANRVINTLMGKLEPTMLHYLEANDIWFIKGDLGPEWDLRFYDRTPPSMRSFDDERSRSSVFTVAIRFVPGADAWQNVHGGRLVP